VTPPVPAWKLEDGPEGPDELDLELDDLIVTGHSCPPYTSDCHESMSRPPRSKAQGPRPKTQHTQHSTFSAAVVPPGFVGHHKDDRTRSDSDRGWIMKHSRSYILRKIVWFAGSHLEYSVHPIFALGVLGYRIVSYRIVKDPQFTNIPTVPGFW
jgi:hypothetical protein